MGISQAEVIQILGKPDDMSAIDETVYLNYTHTHLGTTIMVQMVMQNIIL